MLIPHFLPSIVRSNVACFYPPPPEPKIYLILFLTVVDLTVFLYNFYQFFVLQLVMEVEKKDFVVCSEIITSE